VLWSTGAAFPAGTVFIVAGGSAGCAESGGAELLSVVEGGFELLSGAGAGCGFLGARAVPGGNGEGAGRPNPGASGICSFCPDCCAPAGARTKMNKAATKVAALLTD